MQYNELISPSGQEVPDSFKKWWAHGQFIHSMLVGLLFTLIVLPGCSRQEPPGIVLIISDDQGYGDFGFTGNPVAESPTLDAFKEQSVSFDRFYVSPVCAPTRASLLTGRYHLRTGTSWVTHGKEVMDAGERTLAESLHDHGYITGCFGKWHNGEHYPHHPNGQGFDTFFGFCAGHWNNYFDTKLEYNGEEVRTKGYIADVLTDSALAFISRNRDQPFFCYIPYNTPHSPFQVPDRYYDTYRSKGVDPKNASVYGMCENIDVNVGRILKLLDSLELADNTIVLYTTDNGPNGHRYNAGMKGIKGHVDEGGVRVPLLVRYPDKLKEGMELTGLASHIDLLPTLHGLAGLSFSPSHPLDGIDLSPYMINGNPIPDRLIFTHQVHRELRSYPASVRSPGYRLVVHREDTMLYDMIEDPGQHHDISASQPETRNRLLDTLRGWYREITANGAEVPPIPAGYDASPRTRLPAVEADLNGSVGFMGKQGWANDWLVNFEPGNHRVSWKLDIMQAGTYQLSWRADYRMEGENNRLIVSSRDEQLTVPLSGSLVSAPVSSPDRLPRKEVYEREWIEEPLDTLFLRRGSNKLELEFRGDRASTLQLKSLFLSMVSNSSERD